MFLGGREHPPLSFGLSRHAKGIIRHAPKHLLVKQMGLSRRSREPVGTSPLCQVRNVNNQMRFTQPGTAGKKAAKCDLPIRAA